MKSNKNMKKWVAAGLSVAMLLGGSTAVYADHHAPGHKKQQEKWNNKGKWNNNGKWNDKKQDNKKDKKADVDLKITFNDLGNLEWARKHIANLAAMRIFEGYDDGSFKPNKPVTRLEAVITAVRLMDLRDEAEAAADANLNFKDAQLIEKKYPNAVGYVALAAENDLFIETEDKLQPETPATRLWIATMLIKALGLEDDAMKLMNSKLSFKDANAIPAGSVGYVALAVEKGIVFGYDNGTFQPNKPVTRAEIAAFLDRTGQYMPGFNENVYTGELLANIDDDELIIHSQGKTVQLPVDPDAFIYRDGKQVKASELKAGDELLVRTYNGTVIFIDVLDPNGLIDDDKDDEDSDDNDGVTDAFSATVSDIDKDDEEIRLEIDKSRKWYELDDDAVIRLWDGSEGKLSDLHKGDRVFVRVEDGDITFIHILEYRLFDFEGVLLTAFEDGKAVIKSDSGIEEYELADDVEIIKNNIEVNAKALTVLDEIEVKIENDEIVKIEVKNEAPIHQTLPGVLAAPVHDGKITITTEDHTLQYELAQNVSIIRDGVNADLDDLRVGDELKAQVLNNQVISIEVTDPMNANISFEGTIKTEVDDELVLEKDGLTISYELAKNVQIYRNGQVVSKSKLKAGDEAIVMVVDQEVVLITVTNSK